MHAKRLQHMYLSLHWDSKIKVATAGRTETVINSSFTTLMSNMLGGFMCFDFFFLFCFLPATIQQPTRSDKLQPFCSWGEVSIMLQKKIVQACEVICDFWHRWRKFYLEYMSSKKKKRKEQITVQQGIMNANNELCLYIQPVCKRYGYCEGLHAEMDIMGKNVMVTS